MATNLDMLLDVKNAIFVDEIITKTREGGLPWEKEAGDQYSVTICEPPLCFIPNLGGDSWRLVITRLPLVGGIEGEPVFSLDVLVNSLPYMSFDSRRIANVETLFSQTEKTVARSCRLNRAISFISGIPSSPETAVSDFVMCGGVVWSGAGRVFAYYYPREPFGGSIVSGQTAPYVMMFPEHSGGALLNGSNTNQAVFQPQNPKAGVKDAGTATITMIWSQNPSGGSKAGGAAVVS